MKRDDLLAYCAGFIDGDGTISVAWQKQSHSNGMFYRPYISASGKDRKPLDRLVGVLGGSVSQPPSANGDFRYRADYRQAVKACGLLLPFLIAKRDQAEGITSWPTLDNKGKDAMMHRIWDLNEQPVLYREPDKRCKRSVRAYLAGVLDAEGYFDIAHLAGGKRKPIVATGMSDFAILAFGHQAFGGVTTPAGKTAAGTQMYRWDALGPTAKIVCKASLPYVTLKHEPAEIVIRYQNNVELWTRRLGSVNQFNLPERVRRKREKWEARLKELHYHRKAGAETKPEQPRNEVSDSPFPNEPQVRAVAL